MRREWALVVTFAVVTAGCLGGSSDVARGEDAPDFTIVDVDGETFRLSSFEGDEVVLIQLMGANCPSCHAMTKRVLHPFYTDYVEGAPEAPPLTVISVDLGGAIGSLGGSSEEETREWRDEFQANWTVARDSKSAGVADKYDLIALPTLYLVDKEGEIAWVYGGTPSIATLRAAVEEAVAA